MNRVRLPLFGFVQFTVRRIEQEVTPVLRELALDRVEEERRALMLPFS